MFRFRECGVALLCLSLAGACFAQSARYVGVGRAATPQEVAKWDIDVRPDFKGLPKGSGSVAAGQDVWEAKCAQCHGVFGESNEVFSPLVGGTTASDVKTGRVANLSRTDFPGRTTMMKLATVSTLWDYIYRAMPWTQPKSLSADEVYAVTAFLLNLAYVVPDDFVLSEQTMAQAQARMPNRLGMNTRHALWPGREFGASTKPDTDNTRCMSNCKTELHVASFLPDFARNAHGNLRDQNRGVGQQLGADTTRGERNANPAKDMSIHPPQSTAKPEQSAPTALLNQHSCSACHAIDRKLVGPSFQDIAKKYPGQADHLASKIKAGGSGVWGAIPMPPQNLPLADSLKIAQWLSNGAQP